MIVEVVMVQVTTLYLPLSQSFPKVGLGVVYQLELVCGFILVWASFFGHIFIWVIFTCHFNVPSSYVPFGYIIFQAVSEYG